MDSVVASKKPKSQKKSLILAVPKLSAQEVYALELAELRGMRNLDNFERCLEVALLDGVDCRVDAEVFVDDSLSLLDYPETPNVVTPFDGFDETDFELESEREMMEYLKSRKIDTRPHGLDWDADMPYIGADDDPEWEVVGDDDPDDDDPIAGTIENLDEELDLVSTKAA